MRNKLQPLPDQALQPENDNEGVPSDQPEDEFPADQDVMQLTCSSKKP